MPRPPTCVKGTLRASAAKGGMAGGLLARAEAHVLRLSLIYALVDGAAAIGVEHLRAALALWEYCQRGVALFFSDATGDPLAEAIGVALCHAPNGMTRTEEDVPSSVELR